MRVIAGKYRGRPLLAPQGSTTRPILDRVKVALFDWLGSMLDMPGSLPPLNVLDIFCGGGSLGIEALSRGAASCTFIETDREALRCLRQNLATLRTGAAANILNCPAQSLRADLLTQQPISLIFLDPPYQLSESTAPGDTIPLVFNTLHSALPVADEAILLWRHDSRTAVPDNMGDRWRKDEARTWGHMTISLFRRNPPHGP